MKFPKGHLNQLVNGIAGHETRLNNLRLQIQTLQDEASAHEMIVSFGHNRQLVQVIKSIIDKPELSEPLLRDPRAFLEEQGIKVPQEATLEVKGDAEAFRQLEARFLLPTLGYAVGWSEEAGFYVNTISAEQQ